MKKSILHILANFGLITLLVCLLGAGLITDDQGKGIPIQGFGANKAVDNGVTYQRNLTVASTTIDMSKKTASNIYNTTSGCVFRSMSSATKAGLTRTVPTDQWFPIVKHKNIKYMNYSGCTNAQLDEM
jgi:hypothetical protein